MGAASTIGLDDLISDLSALAELPNSVIDDMLKAEADVIEPEQHRTAKSMGVYRTGVTEGSIKRTTVKSGSDGRYLSIYPQGKNADGNSNAEVAFINEFGKRGQPARPFIDTANKNKSDQAVGAAEKVYNAFVDGKNL